MSDGRKIHFHIGAPKTASSFLAAGLRANQEELSRQGLDVVFRRDILDTGFAQELYEVRHDRQPPDAPSQAAREAIRSLIPDGPNNVLVTMEDLLCRLSVQDFYLGTEPACRYLCACLPEFDIRIILYLRKQPDYLESVYMQYVHLGRDLKFERFLKRAQGVDLSWLRVLEDIGKTIPQDHVSVRLFESIRDRGSEAFFRDFLSLCGVEDSGAYSVSETASTGRRANRSYGEVAMKIAQRANPLLNGKEKKLLRKFLQEHFSTATHARATLLDAEQRLEISRQYAASNRAVLERHDTGADGGALGYY